MKMISLIMAVLGSLISMAFFTLLERKVLGYMMIRKGPNKVGLMGIPQPLADALKLFMKENLTPSKSNRSFFFFPVLGLFLAMMLWTLYPFFGMSWLWKFSLLMFLVVSSVNIYTLMGAGFVSNSKYAMLGSLRSLAQTISYEISLVLILLMVILGMKTFDFSEMDSLFLGVLMMPVFFVWMVSCLAETMRTPFDHAEGESELVSGFNVEYGGGLFAFIFMGEYMNIMFMSLLSFLLFISSKVTWVGVIILSFWFVWVRGTLPRMRYDKLMSLTWKVFLPVMLLFFYLQVMVL